MVLERRHGRYDDADPGERAHQREVLDRLRGMAAAGECRHFQNQSAKLCRLFGD
jgi:hypothetical protein